MVPTRRPSPSVIEAFRLISSFGGLSSFLVFSPETFLLPVYVSHFGKTRLPLLSGTYTTPSGEKGLLLMLRFRQ